MAGPRSVMHPDNAKQLTQFLRWLVPSAFGFAIFTGVGGPLYGDVASIRTSFILVAAGLMFLVARALVQSGRTRQGLMLTVATILGAGPICAINQPINFAISLVPLLAVGVSMSLLSGRRLAVFMVAAWLTTLATSVALAIAPAATRLPSWYTGAGTALATVTAVGLYLLLSWQASERQRSALERAEAAMTARVAAEDRHRTLVEQLPGVVYVAEHGSGGAWHYVSPQIERILGFPAGDWLADRHLWARQVHEADRERIVADEDAGTSAPDGVGTAYEYRMLARDGREVWIRDEEVVISRHPDGRPHLVQGVLLDITDRRRLEEELAHRAAHDPLTRLANRTVFRERLIAAVQSPDAVGRVGILYIDIDDFKLINDTLGHAAGDELLIAVSRRLETAVRGDDLAARAGGDEFTVLMESMVDEADVTRIADRVAARLAEPVVIHDREMRIGVSIGIAVLEDVSTGPDELMAQADAALYEAKARGKARHQRFHTELADRAWRRLEIEAELRTALEREEFVLHFQPVVEVDSGIVEGVEALVRWQHPVRGLVPPGEFIPIAEQSGLIVPLGRWILDESCRQVSQLETRRGRRPVSLSVNLSARQFTDPGVLEAVAEALRRSDLPANRLRLEITESVLLLDDDQTAKTIEGLQALGVDLVVDDFGTGYSALSYLKRLPVSGLKIDRSFVAGLGTDVQDAAIVSAAMAFARALGLRVTGEGVETAEQLDALRTLGCELAQGYLFARPIPAEELALFLSRRRRVIRRPRPPRQPRLLAVS
ncbi:MAG TPA: EAL domain-containing protein [Candidatus Limnocylindrales bacterium]